MTQTLGTAPLRFLEFKNVAGAGKDVLSTIVKEYGIVYVTSITRDGCSGCEEQKPLFEELAKKIDRSFPAKASFNNIHIRYSQIDPRESEDSKRILGHGSYPTYMVHVKSRYGCLEHFRAAYPKMEELEKQIIDAFELAEYYEKQSQPTE